MPAGVRDIVDEYEDRRIVAKALGSLSDRDAEIVVEVACAGVSMTVLAREQSCSRTRIEQRYSQAMRTLRRLVFPHFPPERRERYERAEWKRWEERQARKRAREALSAEEWEREARRIAKQEQRTHDIWELARCQCCGWAPGLCVHDRCACGCGAISPFCAQRDRFSWCGQVYAKAEARAEQRRRTARALEVGRQRYRSGERPGDTPQARVPGRVVQKLPP